MKKIKESEAAEIIRCAGFRATTPRIAVFSFLQKTSYPVTIRQILKDVRPRTINQTTVYRMLESFKKAGLVVQIDFQHGHAHYELAGERHHHHVVCTSCEKVEDVRGCNDDQLTEKALRQTSHFSGITSHSLEFFGVCKSCAPSR